MARLSDPFFLHSTAEEEEEGGGGDNLEHINMDPSDPISFVFPSPAGSDSESVDFPNPDAILDFLEMPALGSGSVFADEEENHPDWGADRRGLWDAGSDYESDFDSQPRRESEIFATGVDDSTAELGIPLQWDCLRLEDARREQNDDFEWEEVDERPEPRQFAGRIGPIELDDEGEEEIFRNVEWEILLAMNNYDRQATLEQIEEDYVYTSEYEVLIGQLTSQNENSTKGRPPAAKSFVENLPSVVFDSEDSEEKHTNCAVCKDEIASGESAKKLPCLHCYHGECILPWLAVRNTCPVCRYELPSDDPDYESSRTTRANVGQPQDESQLRVVVE